jgi:hypothetical protein
MFPIVFSNGRSNNINTPIRSSQKGIDVLSRNFHIANAQQQTKERPGCYITGSITIKTEAQLCLSMGATML